VPDVVIGDPVPTSGAEDLHVQDIVSRNPPTGGDIPSR
jgi:hypothetical protein